ncbi:phage baseplate assembly protein V [Microbacterium deminutum]|uniref:Gp5/Type VI secretion system Vgr protein OB-fold domain-containing protein n=1 Tax=Microbacterium deminutum TaxID=344164 RepID=A0ABP5CSL1_9MICO
MSIHRGTVIDVVDPAGLGRLSVEIPAVGVEPMWAPVVIPFGVDGFQPPEIGIGVWVAFEADDSTAPVVLGVIPQQAT